MEWLENILFEHSVVQAVIVTGLICAVGLALGKVRVFGISLGVTLVFFVGILAGHFGFSIDPQMLHFAESFGLIIFVYALGLQVGPGFFGSFRKGGISLNLLSLAVILIGTVMTVAFHYAAGVPLPDMIGILSGAVTNTPALGAAQQTLKLMHVDGDPALGCAVTYPLGVVGVILALIVLRKIFPGGVKEKKTVHEDEKQVNIGVYTVCNPAIFGQTLKEVAKGSRAHFVASRLWRDGKASIPDSSTELHEKDRILVLTTHADEESVKLLFGNKEENENWNKEDIDWSGIDSNLSSFTLVVTRPSVNGKRLGALRLRNLYGINVTRVYRAGVPLLATPELVLQLGDRLVMVGEASALEKLEGVLGNRVKSLKEPYLVTIFLGIVLGLILGSIPFAFPGIDFPVRLGIAGGPIIMGILVGAFGPRLHLITYTTRSANLMLRSFGLALYLACLGLDAGSEFFATVFRPEGLLWVGLGFLITVVPVLLVGLFAQKVMKLDFGSSAGMLCGSMANPMALNYVNTTLEGDESAVSYATVYPLAMFIRVLLAQLVLMMFL